MNNQLEFEIMTYKLVTTIIKSFDEMNKLFCEKLGDKYTYDPQIVWNGLTKAFDDCCRTYTKHLKQAIVPIEK